jgi:hypothetical protein
MLLRCGPGFYRAWIRQRSWGQERDHQESHRNVLPISKARQLAACLWMVLNFGMDRTFKPLAASQRPAHHVLQASPQSQLPVRPKPPRRESFCLPDRSQQKHRRWLKSAQIPLFLTLPRNTVPMFVVLIIMMRSCVGLHASGAKTLRERSLQIRSSAPPSKSAKSPV